jgi:hypothetical protein
LVATAVPASAASNTVQSVTAGGLIIVSQSAVYASSKLTVAATAVHTAAPGAAPVTGLTVTMTFSGYVLSGGQTPTNVASGWTFTGWTSAPNSGTYVFTFRYDGSPLTVNQPGASPLSATFANWSPGGAPPIPIVATGTSSNVGVTANATAVPTQKAVLVWNSINAGVDASYPPPNYTKVVSNFKYDVSVRHNGPQNPNADSATNLVVTAAYDSTKVNAPAAGTVGNWVVTPLGVSGGVGRVACAYQGALAYGATASALALSFPAKTGATSSQVTFTATFDSAGAAGTIAAQSATAS